ncbi:uncharacterized protein RJT20DRAFT_56301 [Scheffersomyces xylosifermentans]|uniref:uncharacterized protein n=1 Tax=Scheffersomyces xylosifermentans TaxID=1304137 RepID=UPI00315DAB4A
MSRQTIPEANRTRSETAVASPTVQSQQELILLELEMIRDTVKQIDENLVKSILLLRNSNFKSGSTSSVQKNEDYSNVVNSSVESITSILKMLGRYTADS